MTLDPLIVCDERGVDHINHNIIIKGDLSHFPAMSLVGQFYLVEVKIKIFFMISV